MSLYNARMLQTLMFALTGMMVSVIVVPVYAQTISYYQTGEEFAGPFPSWKNVKTDFGAKGDGVADDAPAITAAINAIKTGRNNWCVLYFPAGTYLIKSTVYNTDRNDQDNMGMNLVGEDPATTKIVCSDDFTSPEIGQGAMFRLDGTYGNLSRLSFDGKGKAKVGVLRDGGYGTDWRITDLFVKNVGVGIQWGGASGLGEDLSVMARCRFTNCRTGITATNQNAMGPYAWYCLFEDCNVGIDNGVGFVHSIGNVYLRSKECDIKQGYIGYLVLNNTSINSNRFLGFIEDKTICMANGNKIYNTVDPVSIQGVGVMLDNTIRSRRKTGPALLTGRRDTLCVGNTFTVTSPVQPIYQPANAIDGNPATVCYDPNSLKYSASPRGAGAFELVWALPVPTRSIVTKYAITAGANLQSAPCDFQLYVSGDGAGQSPESIRWNLIDTRTGIHWTTKGQRLEFSFNNATQLSQFRLVVTANQNAPVNTFGDRKGGVEIAEWQLLDEQGHDVTKDKGTLTGRLKDFAGGYTAVDEKIVDPDTLPVPTTVRLPGVPENRHRKVFEVRPGTGDDATEIQQQVEAAALEPDGSNPVIHIPKGAYQLDRTIALPARRMMQLVGDGGRGAVALSWGGTGTGLLFLMHGPSRVTMREMNLVGNGSDAVHMDNCDQVGGRIYCDQVDFVSNYGDGTNGAEADVIIDGVENSDITFLDHYIGSAKKGVWVKGGPVLSAGGTTKGQISFLMGYIWGAYNAKFLNVTQGGRLLFCGYRAENTQKGMTTLTPSSSGALTWACNNDAVGTYTNTPFVINGFKGTLCTVSNSMWPNEALVPMYDISGDGSRCKVLSACNCLGGGADRNVPIDHIWKDVSAPAAQAAMLHCQGIFQDWHWDELPNMNRKVVEAKPDDQFIGDCLQQLRSLRLEPPMNRGAGVTDIKLIRVPIDVGNDRNGIIMRAGADR